MIDHTITCMCFSKTSSWTSGGEKFLLKSRPHSPTATHSGLFTISVKAAKQRKIENSFERGTKTIRSEKLTGKSWFSGTAEVVCLGVPRLGVVRVDPGCGVEDPRVKPWKRQAYSPTQFYHVSFLKLRIIFKYVYFIVYTLSKVWEIKSATCLEGYSSASRHCSLNLKGSAESWEKND